MAFTNEQMERYSRHIILQEVGVKGQKKRQTVFGKRMLTANSNHWKYYHPCKSPTHKNAWCMMNFKNMVAI